MDGSEGIFIVAKTNQIIYGVLVYFPKPLLDAHVAFLEHIYKSSLAPFYSAQNVMPNSNVRDILKTPAMMKKGIDLDSFNTSYGLWRYLNVGAKA